MKFMNTAAASRTDRFAHELAKHGIDAFIGWSPVTMGYLHGFHEGGGERFMTLCVSKSGAVRLICPALSATQAGRSGIQDVQSWRDGESPVALFERLAEDWRLRAGIIAVDDELPAHMLLAMQEALPAALFRPGNRYLSQMMSVKTAEDLELMRQAGAIADQAFPVGVAACKVGATEADVMDALNSEMTRLGGKPLFCIIAAGPNGAEPHHLSDDTAIRDGDVVVMDFGCTVGGFHSDITRTICVGKASDEAKKVYDVVYRAHKAARNAIALGVECQQLDRIARKVIEDAGYGPYFMHRLGHGFGMRGHEDPNIVEGNAHELVEGNVFSIEPGIYLPGRFGVRIENICTVGLNGEISLNEEPSPVLAEV